MAPGRSVKQLGRAIVLAVATVFWLNGADPARAADITIQIVEPSPDPQSWGFKPPTASAKANDKSTWENAGSAQHQLVADNGAFTLGVVKPGDSRYTHAWSTLGEIPYHCAIHPWMKGAVYVTDAAGNAPQVVAAPVPQAPPVEPTPKPVTAQAGSPTTSGGSSGGPQAQAAPVTPGAPVSQPAPTPGFRPVTAGGPVAAGPAPRAGGFPTQLAFLLLGGGLAALGGGALLLRRRKKS